MEKKIMTEKEFHKRLVERFCEHKASDSELEIFFQLLQEGKLDDLMSDAMKMKAGIDKADENKLIARGKNIIEATWRRMGVAAAVLIFLSVGFIYLFNKNSTDKNKFAVNSKTNHQVTKDLAPGTNNAILTLANGNTIILDSASNGVLARQGEVKIVNKDGRLIYNDQVNKSNGDIVYNKMETRRGGQYQLTLADGSKVWLNAASSILFPNVFSGNERIVEITGEVYFEVAKNMGKPFKVKFNTPSGMPAEIEVLGTHFNINAYSDEASVKSTLLEGSIKLTNNISEKGDQKQIVLKPGQQALLNKQGAIKMEENTDVEEAVAWKNGMFQFNRATIEVIMRQVERWYDVDVVYMGTKPAGHYQGEISRNVNASEMLKVLQTSGIRFNIENRKITVMP
ncbi:MAG: FecR domain-containing protein [Ferruginibacter sp.]